jgi:hypothetical protein
MATLTHREGSAPSVSKLSQLTAPGSKGIHDIRRKFSPSAAEMTLFARGGVNLGDIAAGK